MTEQRDTMTDHRPPAPIRSLMIVLVAVVVTAAFGVTDASAHHRPDHAPRSSTTTTTTTPTVTVTLHIHDQEEAEVEAWVLGWWDEPTEEVTIPVSEKGDHRRCTVEVAERAWGDAVLEAARSTGCIESYELATSSTWEWVRCIDRRCNNGVSDYWAYTTEAGFAWAQFADDRRIRHLNEFVAAEGSTLRLSYAAAASACIPVYAVFSYTCYPAARVTAPTP